VKIKYDWI
jgi:hypothetical protein